MKYFLLLILINLVFSCGEKPDTAPKRKVKSTISTEKKSSIDSEKIIEPVEIPEIPKKPIECFPPKSVDCKDKDGDMENGFVTECVYKNYDLNEAYKDFRERNKDNDDGKYLEAKMPLAKHISGFSDYPISVTYTYPKQKILNIDILFPGGETSIIFTENKKFVTIKINHSPD